MREENDELDLDVDTASEGSQSDDASNRSADEDSLAELDQALDAIALSRMEADIPGETEPASIDPPETPAPDLSDGSISIPSPVVPVEEKVKTKTKTRGKAKPQPNTMSDSKTKNSNIDPSVGRRPNRSKGQSPKATDDAPASGVPNKEPVSSENQDSSRTAAHTTTTTSGPSVVQPNLEEGGEAARDPEPELSKKDKRRAREALKKARGVDGAVASSTAVLGEEVC